MTDINSTSGSSALDLITQTTNPSKAEGDRQKLADDFDEFLLLLTTQLENQDPTEPLDTNEFTNQLVAFTQAEQAVQTNTNLEELIDLQSNNGLNSAVSYIGKVVDAAGNASQLDESGYAQFTYELDAPAATTTLVITDGAGRAVYSGQGPTESGKNRVLWDGVNSFTGGSEPDGTYFINVVAKSASGDDIPSKTFTSGSVTGAEVIGGEIILQVAGSNVKLSDVQSVREPVTVPVEQQEGA